MRKKKTIVIRDPRLRKLRKELRNVIRLSVNKEFDRLIEESDEIYYEVDELGNRRSLAFVPEVELQARAIIERKNAIYSAYSHPILQCPLCKAIDKDMAYNPEHKRWYCVDCYAGVEWHQNRRDQLLRELVLSKEQIAEFLIGLAEIESDPLSNDRHSCARKVLTKMHIPKEEQDKFLELCEEYDGYNDAEILLNATPHLLGEQADALLCDAECLVRKKRHWDKLKAH